MGRPPLLPSGLMVIVALALCVGSVVEVAVTVTLPPVGTVAGAVKVVAPPLAVCAGLMEPQSELVQETDQSTPAAAVSLIVCAVSWTDIPTSRAAGGAGA